MSALLFENDSFDEDDVEDESVESPPVETSDPEDYYWEDWTLALLLDDPAEVKVVGSASGASCWI